MKPKKMHKNKENRSINQLLGFNFNEDLTYNSYVIKRCTELCNVPISKFEIEDYRLLISQGIALKYIVPSAIEILSNNLFAEGDFYEGDLLKSILTIDESFWQENPNLKDELKKICNQNFGTIETLELSGEIKENLYSLVKMFMKLE